MIFFIALNCYRPVLVTVGGLWCRSFAAKDDIFCLFEGTLENLPRLKQQYGLGKNANEVVLVMEAYKALRDRAPYPANHMVAHLVGQFAFIVFDRATSTVFVASVSVKKKLTSNHKLHAYSDMYAYHIY